MSNISNNDPFDAIEDAIKSASYQICPQVDLDLKMFDPLTQGSFNSCYPLFNNEIAAERHRISNDQYIIDQIKHTATWGWLHGYSCAQNEALLEISSKDTEISNKNTEINGLNQKLGNTQNDLTQKTKEATRLKAKLEQLQSSDPERRAKRWRLSFLIAAAVAIGAGITIIVCVIINSQMMG